MADLDGLEKMMMKFGKSAPRLRKVSAYSCSVLCGWINGSGTTSTVLSFNTADVAVTWHFYSTRMTNAVR